MAIIPPRSSESPRCCIGSNQKFSDISIDIFESSCRKRSIMSCHNSPNYGHHTYRCQSLKGWCHSQSAVVLDSDPRRDPTVPAFSGPGHVSDATMYQTNWVKRPTRIIAGGVSRQVPKKSATIRTNNNLG